VATEEVRHDRADDLATGCLDEMVGRTILPGVVEDQQLRGGHALAHRHGLFHE
jgi:hypothetical protein